MLNKVITLIGTCVLSLTVHADIYHFNGIITDVTGPDVPYNIDDQFNFTIEIDFQAPGYRTIGTTVDFLASTENYTYYAAEYISGDAVENVAQDGWTEHFYIDYAIDGTGTGSGSINVLNNLQVFAGVILSIDSWDADTNITFIQTWRNDFVTREIRGQITSFIVDDDSDSDGVSDATDNCTLIANTDQRDTNGDGYGNLCDFDYNNDCVVNFLDLPFFADAFLATPGDANWNPDVDFNGDDLINFLDLGAPPNGWAGYFLDPPGPSASACVLVL